MALSLDGFDVMQRLAANRELFLPLRGDTAEAAERLVRRMLVSSAVDFDTFRAIVAALGEDAVDLVLQTMSIAEVRTLLERIEPGPMRPAPRRHASVVRRLLRAAALCEVPARPQRREGRKEPLAGVPLSTRSMLPDLDG
jgi:hypothetical protein